MIRIRIRVRPQQVMEELDPQVARSAAASVAGVRGVDLWDERVSDALYVTLDVFVDERTSVLEEDLRAALGALPGMDAFLVVAHGEQVAIGDAVTDDWDQASRVVA